MTLKLPLLATLLALSGCSGSDPADALATVADMTMGLNADDSLLKKTADDPLTYSGNDGQMILGIAQKDDCHYDYTVTIKDRGNLIDSRFSFDFKGLTAATQIAGNTGMGGAKFVTSLDGATMTCGDTGFGQQLCSRFAQTRTTLFSFGTAERTRQAFEHFKADICRG